MYELCYCHESWLGVGLRPSADISVTACPNLKRKGDYNNGAPENDVSNPFAILNEVQNKK